VMRVVRVLGGGGEGAFQGPASGMLGMWNGVPTEAPPPPSPHPSSCMGGLLVVGWSGTLPPFPPVLLAGMCQLS
jgi:hypothetical protein